MCYCCKEKCVRISMIVINVLLIVSSQNHNLVLHHLINPMRDCSIYANSFFESLSGKRIGFHRNEHDKLIFLNIDPWHFADHLRNRFRC